MEELFDVKSFDTAEEDAIFRGVALCKNIARKKTKADKPYYTFILYTMEGSVPAKLWSDNNGKTIFEDSYGEGTLADRVVQFEGRKNSYNGLAEMKIDNIIELSESEYDKKAFMKRYYDIEALKKEMDSFIKSNISATGIELIKKFFENPDEKARFEEEFAATSHHDNCLNGLYAHTLKVMKWTKAIVDMYDGSVTYADSDMTPTQRKDLLYVGALIHDIDKINEMHYGEYQPASILNHRVRGIIRIAELRDFIIDNFNESFYNHLIMMVDGHHGLYGDPIETLYAYILHTADDLDAKLTVVEKDLSENVTNNTSGKTIKIGLPNAVTYTNVNVKI
jgi:23S rRNA maturation-related 3'-5' exoribonuclease YhaM